MNDDELKAIRERCEAEKRWYRGDDLDAWVAKLTASRADIPALLAEVDRLKAIIFRIVDNSGFTDNAGASRAWDAHEFNAAMQEAVELLKGKESGNG